jgi:hypothetical protein
MESKHSTYEIRIDGELDPGWADWFEGMEVRPQGDGSTLLRGQVEDQAALHGVLARVRDLGVTLLSVRKENEKCS